MSLHRLQLIAIGAISAAALFTGRNAFAQHPDVSPRVANGQIVTDGYNDDDDTVTPSVRVFNFVFGEDDPSQPFFAGDPGFHAVGTPGFAVGSKLHFNILPGSTSGLPADLTYWDGNGSPTFGAVPADETVTLKLGGLTATADSSDSPITGYNIGSFTSADPPLHVHLSSFINGSTGNDPTPGIYLMSLGLTTDSPGVSPAQPIFILYDNGLSDAQLLSAIDFAQATLVPEPSAFVLMSFAFAATGAVVLYRRWKVRVACSVVRPDGTI